MTSPAKRKGDAFERAVVEHLRANGHPAAERCYGAGRPDDVGDIDGVAGWTLQLRNLARLDVAGAVDAAERQRAAAGSLFAAAVLKRRGKPPGASYVVLDLDTFARLLADRSTP
jgi:hypothetical protein